MIVCVANSSPAKVKSQLRKKGVTFAMWKEGEACDPDTIYGFFAFEDIAKSKVKRTPFFFNIVSAFDHIRINHPILRYDFVELPTGLVMFKAPNMKQVLKAVDTKFAQSAIRDIAFKPSKVRSYEGSELSRRWNNFIITLPSCVAETFMVFFLKAVRENDKEAYNNFVVDNRLVGTGNKAAYTELHEIIGCMWAVMHACAAKTERMDELKKKFLKKNPSLDTSLSRFLFWNKSYKGTDLAQYMDDENNVSYGIKE